jgi:hypothetical protein
MRIWRRMQDLYFIFLLYLHQAPSTALLQNLVTFLERLQVDLEDKPDGEAQLQS